MFKPNNLQNLFDYLSFNLDDNGEAFSTKELKKYLIETPFEKIEEELNGRKVNSENQVSILNFLAASGQSEILKEIMEYDKKHNYFINWSQQSEKDKTHTPLLKAVYHDQLEIVNLLIHHYKEGADIDFSKRQYNIDDNALFLCVRLAQPHSLEILNAFLDPYNDINFDLYESDEVGYGLISVALTIQGDLGLRLKLVHSLIEHGHDCNQEDKKGDSLMLCLMHLTEETGNIRYFKENYELYHDKLHFTPKMIQKMVRTTVYSSHLDFLTYFYNLPEIEKKENIEYAQKMINEKKINILLDEKNIQFFKDKYVEIFQKEKESLENLLMSSEKKNKKLKV